MNIKTLLLCLSLGVSGVSETMYSNVLFDFQRSSVLQLREASGLEML